MNTDFFYWANVNVNFGFSDAKITGDIDPSLMLDLALSGNKAVLFFEDSVDYYRMTGYDVATIIELLFSKNLENWSAAGQYVFKWSCLCAGVKRFSCYSSTLNCLIIKAADVECGTKDIPVIPEG